MIVFCRKCNRQLSKQDYDEEKKAFKCPKDGFYSGYLGKRKPPST